MNTQTGLVVSGLALVALALVAVIAYRSYKAEAIDFVRWPVPAISSDPGGTGIGELEQVAFESADRLHIAGWYAPSGNRAAVVLVHGTNADRAAVLAETRILASAGFGALAIDLPGQGASAGRTQWGGQEERAVAAAIDWLAARPEVDPQRIGALGVSFGGYIVLQVAARDPRLKAVTLVSTPADLDEETRRASARWGVLSQWPALIALHRYRRPGAHELPAPEAIARIAPRAVLLISGRRDPWVPPETTRQLYQAAGEPRLLWIAPQASHADLAQTVPSEYARHLVDFFRSRLLTPSASGG